MTTERDTKRIKLPSFKIPMIIWIPPHNKVAASKYCKPCSATKSTITSAIAPVAAEIIPGRPPTKLITTAIQNDAYKPTFGSTPAIIEKAIASGIKASATTKPDNVSPRILENHSSRKLPKKDVISKLHRVRGKKNNHF